MQSSEIISDLNPAQREAVEYNDGPLLILAGAGSGKTRVLTRKVAYLVANDICAPQNILAVTFTNKAAQEMKNRISEMLKTQVGVNVFTFHSFGARILRRFAHKLGLDAQFTIYDSNDQLSFCKKLLENLKVSENALAPKKLVHIINDWKSSPQNSKQTFAGDHLIQDVIQKYEQLMRKSNAVDFSDLLYKTYLLLEQNPDIKSQLQSEYQYLLIDEYQDTNHVQYMIAKHIAEQHKNICAVGDEDQSIYSWRGADIGNIMNFEHDFTNTKIIKLEENYRSTKTIIQAASQMIENNKFRKGKKLFTNNPEGEKIKIVEKENDIQEAKYVTQSIRQLCANDSVNYSEIALFYRTNAQSRVLEEELRMSNIPYQIIGGLKFYSRKEIKDIVSYLNLVVNPKDDIAFRRVVNVPARGLGKTSIDKIEDLSNQSGISLIEGAIQSIQQKQLTSRAAGKLGGFLDLLVKLRSKASQLSVYELYTELLHDSGYLVALKEENTQESQSRIENLEAFGNGILRYQDENHDEASLTHFLQQMALVNESDDKEDSSNQVTLMTLHVSKGLEFPYVYIVGLEENLFPSGSRSSEVGDEMDLEEERRLFYVGMTRAEKSLSLIYCKSRRVWGSQQFNEPSRFLKEIPSEFVEQQVMRRPSSSLFVKKFNSPQPAHDFDYDQSNHYEEKSFSSDRQSNFRQGMKVRHPDFGAGSVYQIEGQGENEKITVLFSNNTIKKFMSKFANLQVI